MTKEHELEHFGRVHKASSGQDEYEYVIKQATLQHLLPPTGHRLIEIGAGRGRFADLYGGYDEVVLFEQSFSQLHTAQDELSLYGLDQAADYVYCLGDFSNPPFAPDRFDTVVMTESTSSMVNIPEILRSAAQLLVPDGTLIVGFTSKRSLNTLVHYLLRYQNWSPFNQEPVGSKELGYRFHPTWMREQLADAGLRVKEIRTFSHFCFGFLRWVMPTWLVVELSRPCHFTGMFWYLASSVFMLCDISDDKPVTPGDSLFRCPSCGSVKLRTREDTMLCLNCNARFQVRDGIYDFRTPLDSDWRSDT